MRYFFAPRTRLRIAWLAVGVHVCAILAMLLVLLNGLPPGDLIARRAFVATHQLPWGIGWSLWALATLTLILFMLAWADAMPHRAFALLGIGLTFAGALVDWTDETILICLAPSWAMRAASDPFYANVYALWDRAYIVLSIGLANLLYTLGGIVLNGIAFKTQNFPKWLAWWGVPVWSLSLVLSYAAFTGEDFWIALVSAGIFALFLPWLLLVGYGWLIRE